MKLGVEHIAPYFPHKLMVWNEYYDRCYNKKASPLTGILIHANSTIDCFVDVSRNGYPLATSISKIKPILRPLSNFDDVFTYLVDGNYLKECGIEHFHTLRDFSIERCPVGLFNILVKHHFDVFGLIEKDLAINMNELPESIS